MEPIESLPADVEGLHRGLLWVAREVAECERSLRRASDEMGALGGRLGGLEVREQALVRAAQGVEEFRRELSWMTAEVRARSQVLAAATERLDEVAEGLQALRVDSENEIGALRSALSDVDPAAVKGLVRDELGRTAGEALKRLEEVAAEPPQELLDRVDRAESALFDLERRQGEADARLTDADERQALAVTQSRLVPVLERLDELERRASAAEESGEASASAARVEELTSALAEVTRLAESQAEALRVATEEQAEALRVATESQDEALRVATESQDEALRVATESQDEALRVATESQAEALRLASEEQAEALRLAAEEQAEALRLAAEALRASAERVEALESALAEMARQAEAVTEAQRSDVERSAAAAAGLEVRLEATESAVASQGADLYDLAPQVDGLRHRLEELAAVVSSVVPSITASVAEEAAPLHQAIDELRWRVEQVGAEAGAAAGTATEAVSAQLATIHSRIDGYEPLAAAVAGITHEIDRLTEAAVHRDQLVSALDQRTAPLEGSLDELQGDLSRLTADLAANQQSALWSMQTRIDEISARLTDMAEMPGDIGEVRLQIQQMHAEVEEARHAALTATTEQLASLARLRSLESMPTDLEDVYRELERVSEVASAAAAAGLAELAERIGPMESGAAELRAGLDRLGLELAASLQAAAASSSREVEAFDTRVRALESQAAEVARLAAELERHDVEVVASRGELAEQVNSLSARLARLDAVPTDVESLYRELDRIIEVTNERHAEVAGQAEPAMARLGQVRSDLESLESRLLALEALPEAVASVQGEIPSLAARVADLGSEVAGVPLTVADLRSEVVALRSGLEEARGAADRSLAELAAGVRALEALPSELASLERTVDDVADMASAESGGMANLRGRLEAVANEATEAARRVLDEMAERVDALAERVVPLEESSLQLAVQRGAEAESVGALRARLDRAVEDLEAERRSREQGAARLASLEAGLRAVESVATELERWREEMAGISSDSSQDRVVLEARVRVLEGLPAEMSDLRRELDASVQRLANEHGNLVAVAGPDGPLGDALIELRSELDRLRVDLRAEIGAAQGGLVSDLGAVERSMLGLQERVVDGGDLAGLVESVRAEMRAEMRAARDQAEGSIGGMAGSVGGMADRLERMEAMASEVADLRQAFDRMAGTVMAGDPATAELRDRLERLVDDVATTRRETLVTATRLDGFESLPGEIGSFQRRLDELVAIRRADAAALDEMRSRLDQVAIRNVDPGALDELRNRIEQVSTRTVDPGALDELRARLDYVAARAVEPGTIDEVRVRLDQLAARAVDADALGEVRGRLDLVLAQAGSWQEDARSLGARIDDLEGLPMLVAGMGRLLQRAAAKGVLDGGLVTAVEQRLEGAVAEAVRVSAEGAAAAAAATADLVALSARLDPLESASLTALPGEVVRTQEEIRSLRGELDAVHQAGVVEVDIRTSPLADAVQELQHGLRRLLDESAAVRESLRSSAGGLDALDERTRALEDLPGEVRQLDVVLTRLDRDVISSQQAALTATTYRLAEIDAQLRSFESLRADVDGLYGALHRVAEEVGVPAEDRRGG